MRDIREQAVNTRFSTDLATYRRKIDAGGHARDETIATLQRRDPVTYGSISDPPTSEDIALIKTEIAYRLFAAFRAPGNLDRSYRLGGALPPDRPANLDTLPAPIYDPGNVGPGGNTPLVWSDPERGDFRASIRADGAVVHAGLPQDEEHEAHHYMHGIFDTILYETRRLLDEINQKLEDYARLPDPTTALAYETAVRTYEGWRSTLVLGGRPFSGPFTFWDIYPVVTNEGFIVSARVKLNWRNPYHSSSTVKVP